MTDPKWLSESIFYQIFPDRFYKSENYNVQGKFEKWNSKPTFTNFFGGNLWGIAEKLDYLKELGVTSIYLNPIFSSASNHRYHTHDYFQVDPILGGSEAFDYFLKKAKKLNFRVILDGVFNHASRGFFQFNHILECGPDSPYTDWFIINGYPLRAYGSNKKINYKAWENLPALPKLKTKNSEVRDFIIKVSDFWMDKGIDGWRLDVPFEIEDDFWPIFRNAVKTKNSNAYILGEIWVDEIKNKSKKWLNGDMFDAVMNYGLLGSIISFFIGERLNFKNTKHQNHIRDEALDGSLFLKRLNYLYNLYPLKTTLSQYNLLESHDTSRFLTLSNNDLEIFKLAYLFLFTFPGIPSIYYGSELELKGKWDPHCRACMPWDKLEEKKELYSYFKKLTSIRKKLEPLKTGTFKAIYGEKDIIAFIRETQFQKILILINKGKSKDLAFRLALPDSELKCQLSGKRANISNSTINISGFSSKTGLIFKL